MQPRKVMVLAGGPDRERTISLISGEQVEAALVALGHDVRQRDVLPDDLSALEEFVEWGGEVIFPAMHGAWGEGGALQAILEARGLPYMGCGPEAAALCMDKAATKRRLEDAGLATPPWELVGPEGRVSMDGPLVVKPVKEGSSIDVFICGSRTDAQAAVDRLAPTRGRVMVERFIDGLELTVGILGDPARPEQDQALPAVQVVPAEGFYDYEAKYTREDTQYLFDLPMSATAKVELERTALTTHRLLGCRHLSRVDLMVDREGRPWVLEVNTIPGFTTHSLVPKAAAAAGIGWEALVQRLMELGLDGGNADGSVSPGLRPGASATTPSEARG